MSLAKWMVVQTRAGQERKAARHLRRAGFTIYLALFVDQYRRKRCLFPRYLFMKMQPGWQQVFRTEGVSHVLLSGDDPGLIPTSFIKSLQAQENRNGNIVLVKPAEKPAAVAYKLGQRLKVLRGTFQGFIVAYKGRSAGGRDIGAFKLLGRQVSSEFQSGDLVPV